MRTTVPHLTAFLSLTLLTVLALAQPAHADFYAEEAEDPSAVASSTLSSPTARTNFIFTTAADIGAIKAKVETGQVPWVNAYNRMISDANRALNKAPMSVVTNGAPAGADGDPHKFGTDLPKNASAERKDYDAAWRTSNAIRDLGVGYAFTGNDRYARKCIELLYHWAVNPDTYMHPSTQNFGPHTPGSSKQNSIEHYISIPKMIYGAAFVEGHPAWNDWGPNAESQFRAWVRAILDHAGGYYGSSQLNNIYGWYLVLRSSASVFLGDDDAMAAAVSDWKTDAIDQIEPSGRLNLDHRRTDGLHYSLYGVKALTLTAEIARNYGVDLYSYEDGEGGSALKRAFDFHIPFMHDPASWPYQQNNNFDKKSAAASYEMAHSFWALDEYEDVAKNAGRPLLDQYCLGNATLTHANLFSLDSLPAPGNESPTVEIVAPVDGHTVELPATVAVNISAFDVDGAVVSVHLLVGSELVGVAHAAPFDFVWEPRSPGSYVLCAKAFDDSSAVSISEEVVVTVSEASVSNAPPTIQLISPAEGAVLVNPSAVVFEAEASDVDGTISRIKFLVDGAKVGEASLPEQSFVWTDFGYDTYDITAKVIDSDGAVAWTDPVSISITPQQFQNIPPTVSLVSPAPASGYPAPADITIEATAADTDGEVVLLTLYANGVHLADVARAPYTFVWRGVPVGDYALEARAEDDEGATSTSDPVSISVFVANPPLPSGLVAAYDFSEGAGTVIHNTGIDDPTLDLVVEDERAIQWHSGGGLTIREPTTIRTPGPATALSSACRFTDELTLETWIEVDDLNQEGPARIVTFSASPFTRNFTLGQVADNVEFRLRSTGTDMNGLPSLESESSFAAGLNHVVYTNTVDGVSRLFVNGVESAQAEYSGDFGNWQDDFALILGNELSSARPWVGTYYYLAVYANALTPVGAATHFLEGPTRTPGAAAFLELGHVSGADQVTMDDAALVLQYAAGGIRLEPAPLISADVSGNGYVSSYDASLIQRYVVGLISCFPADPQCAPPGRSTRPTVERLNNTVTPSR